MKGIAVFRSVTDALRAGYQVCDRADDGYLVRVRTRAEWATALVVCGATGPAAWRPKSIRSAQHPAEPEEAHHDGKAASSRPHGRAGKNRPRAMTRRPLP